MSCTAAPIIVFAVLSRAAAAPAAFAHSSLSRLLPRCAAGQAPPGALAPSSASYFRMVERTCHWNCYTAGVDFVPPAPPSFWKNGTYTAQECEAWCDSLPGCTGFEYPTGCSGAACEAYPDKATPGSYCGLFFRRMCQSSSSPGYHVSPGFDTYVRVEAAAPADPYYAYAEQLEPTPVPANVDTEMPPRVASLFFRSNGFVHMENMLGMQLAMDYPIFFNDSALQPDFPQYRARVDEDLRRDAWESVSNLTELFGQPVRNTFAGWTVAAALLLMLELYDAVHEIVLGNQPLLPSSEVWEWLRTFRAYPNSYWLYRPMSPENHYLHAILHRVEGHRVGEAGLIGFENAKFWFGGGVEQPTWGLGLHPVYAGLARAASSNKVLRGCCIFNASHAAAVPGGRLVEVAAGWDPFAFVDFHRAVVEGRRPQPEDVEALMWAQRLEFELLFNYSLKLALDPSADPFLSGVHEEVPVMVQGGSYNLWAQRWGGGPIKVLVLHGGPGCSHVALDSLTGILSPYEYELIFFDQLGCGMSDCSDPSSECHVMQPASLDDFVEQVQQIRSHMHLPAESTLIFGHSWGVMLAIEHALKYPGVVRGYILAGFPASLAAQMRRMHELQAMNVSSFFESFICRTHPCPPSMVWASAHCNEDLNSRLLWTDGGMNCTGVLCGWDRLQSLAHIISPSLLMVGEFDIAAPDDVRRMADVMPQATFVELQGAGHAEWIDAAPQFVATFSTWVRHIMNASDVQPAAALNERRGLMGHRFAHPLLPGVLGLLLVIGSVGSCMSLYRRYRKARARLGDDAPLLTTSVYSA